MRKPQIFLLVLATLALLIPVLLNQDERKTVEFRSEGERIASLQVEIADTPGERRKGLMNRKSLEKGRGMLFIFPKEQEQTFWMKNTYIPLDIIFIDANKTIVDIQQAEPQPNATESELKTYRSKKPSKYVIETNQGFTKQKGIEEGDKTNFHDSASRLAPVR